MTPHSSLHSKANSYKCKATSVETNRPAPRESPLDALYFTAFSKPCL